MTTPKKRKTQHSAPSSDWEGYPEWQLYFPDQALAENYDDDLSALLNHLLGYFVTKRTLPHPLTNTAGVSYPDLLRQPFGQFVATALVDQPTVTLNAMSMAMCVALRQRGVIGPDDGDDWAHIRQRIQIRLHQYEPITPLKHLKSNLVGKLICVRGTVVRTSLVKPILTQISFLCTSCHRRQTLKTTDGKYTRPVKCLTSGCKSRDFSAERGVDGDTQTIDWQRIRIQEKIADDRWDSGRVPRTVECELTHDLVDSILPGDVVNCTGIVKVLQSNEVGPMRNRSQNALYVLYLDAVAISRVGAHTASDALEARRSERGDPVLAGLNSTNQSLDDGDTLDPTSKDAIQFSPKDFQFIRDLFREPHLLKLLVNSFCPSIYGNELIKLGILLSQFGGRRRRTAQATNHIPIRSDPHILIVGDPGMGKSQMLNAAVAVAPRGVYVCGSSGISACGLTVTICKDSTTGDFALEAGKSG
ncbi:hypothetical protein H4R35_007205 [Dimargaris xerosporica]|nr:hypothetical protein H4R35_007205 [Dimargaris xerosporica]